MLHHKTKPKPFLLFSICHVSSISFLLFCSFLWNFGVFAAHAKEYTERRLGLIWYTNGLLPSCWCIFQLDTSTQRVLIFQDTLGEDSSAGLDQGTTPCGEMLCYPANSAPRATAVPQFLPMFSMAIFWEAGCEEVEEFSSEWICIY